jgi:hypothetical protein
VTEPSATRLKLAAAKFFLSKIDRIVGKGGPKTPPELAYYADAFISAARSVPWVMKAEYGRRKGYAEWRSGFPASEDEKFILKRTTKLRNQSQKKEPLRPTLLPMIAPIVFGPSEVVHMEGIGPVHVPTTFKVLWFPALGNMEFQATFLRYLEFLERLVADCERKFPSEPAKSN